MNAADLAKNSQPFLEWAVEWLHSRSSESWRDLVARAGGPERVAVLAVDMTSGFCSQGALASDRVAGIVPAVVRVFQGAYQEGIGHFLLPQDTHGPDALEFGSFPPHCVGGTEESATIPELATLPFADRFQVLPKDSISSFIGTDLEEWLAAHPEVTTFVVVGDCTDLCVYQLAMHLRLRANVLGLGDARVVVPADAVQTYDLPVEVARSIGAMPHDGDLLHLIFLYSMGLNGVDVVAQVR
jgi:nicotinamidase-related amidase